MLALAVAGCTADEEESPPPVTTVIPGEHETEDDSEIADTSDDGREAEDSDHRGKAGKKDKEKTWKGTKRRATDP